MNLQWYKENIIGNKYGDYTVIDVGWFRAYGQVDALVKCNICGHERYYTANRFFSDKPFFLDHSLNSCKDDYVKWWSDIHEYDYKYIGPSEKTIGVTKIIHLYDFKCRVCGNIISITASDYCTRTAYKHYNHSPKICGPENYYKSLIGKVYGDFKVIDFTRSKFNASALVCECQKCGRIKIIDQEKLKIPARVDHRNCSFLIDYEKLPYIEKFRRAYGNMRQRTTNPNNSGWEDYGGRGISSEAFVNFIDFFDAMYPSFLDHIEKYGVENTTLDRIDVNGNYEPDNVRWATWEEQLTNLRKTLYCEVEMPDGSTEVTNNFRTYESISGIPFTCIYERLIGKVDNDNRNGYNFHLISKEEYEKYKGKKQICKIVSDEDKEKYLKLLKEATNNV